jgi:hypothetical protein
MSYVIKQYLLPQDKTTEYLILVIALFLIIIVWAGILYKSTYFGEGQTKALLTCDPGECPTNIQTGEKRCSQNTSSPLQYDPIYEVCNPRNSCSAFQTPYALLPDGSTDISGQCATNNKGCSCVNTLYTPSFVEVMFNQGQNLLNNVPGAQNTFVLNQTVNPYIGEGNNVPMSYTDPSSQFWQIGLPDLPFILPNVCYDLFLNDTVVDVGVSVNCINRNPCMAGRLAYVPQNSTAYSSFNSLANLNPSGGTTNSSLTSTFLACVPNSVENSPSGDNTCNPALGDVFYYAPVFNSGTGRINCIQTNLPILKS